jgi:Raf kinase inhibitor-like YbhB/YbcL family protein
VALREPRGRRKETTIRFRSAQSAVALTMLFGALAVPLEGADAAMALSLTSSAFTPGAAIPSRYTCEGQDISPPLAWDGVPAGTKSLALIIDDPDAPDPKAPKRVWVHWILYNLPADTRSLAENADRAGIPAGSSQGLADAGVAAYGGPCPPIGRHRYFHKLYALDTRLDLTHPTKAELVAAMKGHVLAKAELIGTYQKGDR